MKKLKKEKIILKYFTLIFLFLLPLTGLTFFHHRIMTLVFVIYVLLIFLMTIFYISESRTKLKYLFIYYFLVTVYLSISYYKGDSFISLIPNEYNFFSELLTITKLVMPITFLYSLYYQKIEKKEYMFIIKIWILFIAGLIIISDIFKFGLGSYGNDVIKYNIFEWNDNIYYVYTACKGFFTYANQVSSILLCLLLVSVYFFLYNDKKNIFYILIIMIAMIMLGTRVSTLGGVLSLISILLFYYMYCFIKKEKIKKYSYYLFLVIVIWIFLLPISPFKNRNLELKKVVETDEINLIQEDVNDIVEKEMADNDVDTISEKYKYVLNNYNPNYLPNVFFEKYYPIEYDEDFWYEFVKDTTIENINYRLIEISIVKRMIDINDNKLDMLFGISNSRIQNVINIERDFLLHYYAFGIIGMLVLLLVYIILIIYYVYRFFKYQSFKDFIYTSVVLLFIFSAFLTGNIINSIFPVILFIYIISPVITENMDEKVDKE